MHAADDWMRHAVEVFDGRMQPADHLPEIGIALRRRLDQFRRKRAQIASGHEVAAGAAQYDDAKRGIGGDVGGGVDQRVHQCEVERIERVRADSASA
jgi:hypothetical protein